MTSTTIVSRTTPERACRIPIARLPRAEMTPDLAALVARRADPQLVGVMGHAGDLFVEWYRFFGRIIHEGALDPAVKEAARLRIAALNDCHLCLHMRARDRDGNQVLAEQLAEAAQLGELDHAGFSDVQRRAIGLAEHMFHDPTAITDEWMDGARAELTDGQLVELSLAIGQFIGMGKVFKTFGLAGTIAIDAT